MIKQTKEDLEYEDDQPPVLATQNKSRVKVDWVRCTKCGGWMARDWMLSEFKNEIGQRCAVCYMEQR